MDLSSRFLTLGGHSFTFAETLLAAAAFGLLLLLLAVILAFRAQAGRKAERAEAARRTADMDVRLAELSGAVQSYASQSQSHQIHLQRVIDEADARTMDVMRRHQLVPYAEAGDVYSRDGARLAVIDAAQQNLTTLSGEMLSLKDILNNKQSRGAFGQGRMEAIIRDNLSSRSFAFQATLSNGTRPDCLITLPDSSLRLVIDAKFPLEAFTAFTAAQDEAARKSAEQRLKADIGKHVKDISEKYLLSGETHETAIMFVPSESVYAELHEKFDDVVQKAHRARVILASPNVLMLLVQTMQAIVKDVAMREQAHLIKAEVMRLLEDVERLKERASDLRRHFDMASTDLEKLTTSADRIGKRGTRIENLDVSDDSAAGLPDGARPRLVTGS